MNQPAPTIGHNRPPPYDEVVIADYIERIRQIADDAGAWLDVREIETEADAEKLNDFMVGARRLEKEIEDKRQADKQPHLEAGRAVDARYKALVEPLQRTVDRVKPILTAYSKKKQAAEEGRRRAALEAAQREAEEAQRAADAAAARNDVLGEAEAAEKARAVQATLKDIAKAKRPGAIGSATGGGKTSSLRTYYDAEITSPPRAFMALLPDYEPELLALLTRLAEAKHRKEHAKISRGERAPGPIEINGVVFHERQEIV